MSIASFVQPYYKKLQVILKGPRMTDEVSLRTEPILMDDIDGATIQYPDDPGMHNQPGRGGGDSFTRVNYRDNPTFCQRVQNSLLGVVAGGILICVAIGLLFWNEGRAVQTAKSLDEGLGLVVSLPTANTVNEYNYGKLVHMTGPLRTGKVLFDEKYGIAVPAVKLRRKVEMFQWVEEEKKTEVNEGDRTREEITYDYAVAWKPFLVDSSQFAKSFGHHNPTEMPVTAKELTATDSQVGSFYLSEALVSKINNWKQLTLADPPAGDQFVKVHNQYYYYHGREPLYPVVGDVRVTFEYAGLAGENSKLGSPDQVSVIAKQLHGQLVGYQTDAGDKLELLYMGEYSAQKMFGNEQVQNSLLTWFLRTLGWLLMFIGFNMLTQLINTLVDWFPIVRTLVMMGTITINLSLSIALSLLVIALGWIRYRPWLGLTLIMFSTLPFLFSKLKHHYVSSPNAYRRMRVD